MIPWINLNTGQCKSSSSLHPNAPLVLITAYSASVTTCLGFEHPSSSQIPTSPASFPSSNPSSCSALKNFLRSLLPHFSHTPVLNTYTARPGGVCSSALLSMARCGSKIICSGTLRFWDSKRRRRGLLRFTLQWVSLLFLNGGSIDHFYLFHQQLPYVPRPVALYYCQLSRDMRSAVDISPILRVRSRHVTVAVQDQRCVSDPRQ